MSPVSVWRGRFQLDALYPRNSLRVMNALQRRFGCPGVDSSERLLFRRLVVCLSGAKLSMISALVFRLLVSPMPALHAEEAWESVQVGTNVLKNVTVLQATPIDLILKHESGYLRIKLSDLPEPLKTKYPYDARKAETYVKQKTALQRWDAILARERDLRRQIHDLELQQEGVRAKMRVIRGRRGKPDTGHMQNLQREVDNFEKDKQVLQSELSKLEQIRVAMQGQNYEPPPAPAPAKKKKKKKR